jgi:hypothetical protein
VRADHHVFVQHAAAIQVFDTDTLTAQRIVRVPEEITDIAASGSLLYVASGRYIHVFCIQPDGGSELLRSIVLPKQIDLLATSGRLLYALMMWLSPCTLIALISLGRAHPESQQRHGRALMPASGDTTLYAFSLQKGTPPVAALRIVADAPNVSLTVGPRLP